MELEILQNLGFTHAEATVYLKLLELGSVKVGRIIEKTGLQSSTVHNTINSLINKGFITYILKGKIKTYEAVNPGLILKEFREREERFQEILPRLELRKTMTGKKPEAEIYEGIKGITTMLNELISDSKPKDEFMFFSVDVPGRQKEIQRFFERYDAKRKEKKLMVKGIARKELKPLFEKRTYNKMKYTNFPIPSNISICNNKMAMINWGEKPLGILIKSEQLIESQRKFFQELWEK